MQAGQVGSANVQKPRRLDLLCGSGNWSSQLADAVPVFNGDGILSVAWNNYLQQYIAVFSEPFSQNVLMRTAPSPEGPWSVAVVAFMAMQPDFGNVYDAHAHPEYDADGQTIYVQLFAFRACRVHQRGAAGGGPVGKAERAIAMKCGGSRALADALRL